MPMMPALCPCIATPLAMSSARFLIFNLSSYGGKSVTSDATMTLTAGIYGNILTGVSLGTANSAWTQAGITWNNQPGLTPIAGATNPSGTFGSGPVTWTIPWYMVEKLATTGSGYNNGLGITSGVGSDQHFLSTASGGAPTLTFSSTIAANGTWTGGNGNWTDSADWAGTTVAKGINQTATFNGGTAVDVAMDANFSVGSLSFSGANHTISSGSGMLALNVTTGSPTITVETGRAAAIGATLVGIDGLTKIGPGTLTLTGANTYGGSTMISGGILQIGDGMTNGTIGGGGYSIASGAKMSLNYATAAAPPWSQISGAGTLELNSAQAIDGTANWGSPALPGTFSGKVQVDNGRINGIPANLGGATAVAIGNGAQFLAFDGTTNGTAYTFTQNLSINGMGWGEVGYNLGAIRVSGMNATFSGNMTLTGNSGLFTQNAQNTSMNVTGVISDGGSGYGLTINAFSGGITLSNQNTYTGTTTVAAGTLALTGASIADTNKLVISGGTVNLTGAETVNTLFFGAVQQTAGTYSGSGAGGTIASVNFSGTGTLIVTSGPVAGYASWMAPFITGGLTGDTTPGGDPDNDGINNLLEYAINGNPAVSDPTILPSLSVTSTDFEFTYSRSDLSLADTVQTFEYGSTLAGWTPVLIPAGPGVSTVGIATVTITNSGTTDSVKVSIPRSASVGAKLFGRLKVIK